MPNTPPFPALRRDVRLGVGDVLAEHADPFVGCHLLVQREPDGLAERHAVVLASGGGGGSRGHGMVGQRAHGRGPGWVRAGPSRPPIPRPRGTAPSRPTRICSATSAVIASRQHQPCSSAGPGRARAPRRALRPAVLLLVVGGRMGVGPGDEGVDEARPLAGAHVGHGVRTLTAGLEVVAPVDLVTPTPGSPEPSPRWVRDAGRRPAPRWRSRCRRRRRAPAGEGGSCGIQRLPELAFRRRSLAERDIGELVAER